MDQIVAFETLPLISTLRFPAMVSVRGRFELFPAPPPLKPPLF